MSPQEKASSQTVSSSRDYGKLKNNGLYYTLWMKRMDRNATSGENNRMASQRKCTISDRRMFAYVRTSLLDCKNKQRPSVTRISNVAMKMCINN